MVEGKVEGRGKSKSCKKSEGGTKSKGRLRWGRCPRRPSFLLADVRRKSLHSNTLDYDTANNYSEKDA